jgi:hypothetical protein
MHLEQAASGLEDGPGAQTPHFEKRSQAAISKEAMDRRYETLVHTASLRLLALPSGLALVMHHKLRPATLHHPIMGASKQV